MDERRTILEDIVARFLCAAIRGYQMLISPMLPRCCRFYPSCSAYAIEAVRRHGALKGAALSALRILRCNPFFAGGYDPVPCGNHVD